MGQPTRAAGVVAGTRRDGLRLGSAARVGAHARRDSRRQVRRHRGDCVAKTDHESFQTFDSLGATWKFRAHCFELFAQLTGT
jgi:hypothetical protein